MRLIDADELIVMEYGGIKFVPKEFIDDAPTVDAVEVVRCRYCKHWDMVDLHFHKNICSKLMRPCDESNFCSWAERRQDES